MKRRIRKLKNKIDKESAKGASAPSSMLKSATENADIPQVPRILLLRERIRKEWWCYGKS